MIGTLALTFVLLRLFVRGQADFDLWGSRVITDTTGNVGPLKFKIDDLLAGRIYTSDGTEMPLKIDGGKCKSNSIILGHPCDYSSGERFLLKVR
ncbi:hypothetical protein TSMEX_005545 [Taenia solium]|eukprot:TsM_000548100 transcript=TsM_000548100 gene=TsM_000548100